MKIAQFAESYPPVLNGAAVAVELLAEGLRARSEVRVYAPRFPGHRDGPGVYRFPSYAVPWRRDYPLAFPVAPALFRELDAWGAGIVHTHSPFTLGQVGRRWARRLGIPLVTTYHTLYTEYAHYGRPLPEGLVRRRLRALSRAYCDACDGVAVPTAPIREVLREYGVRTPIRVIPTGLRLAPPVPADPGFPRGALGIPAGAPLVLYAGRLAKEKNLELLFAAFAAAAARVPEAWLLLCGGGPEEQNARRRARETGVGDRIAFAGPVPPDRMGLVYAAADVFAFASLTDTQGLVLTEAKAAGLPAVAVNAYGPGAVVVDGVDGFLVPNDAGAFAAALERVLADSGLRAELRAGALREAQRFSIEATAAEYEALYEEARERGSGGREGK